ncbi:MAG: isoaspartyl peptidase/L-asparaginase, partial [Deltaproteobacteria bacterium]|nr:isoaspartyl peptidase/L-asparaginase [Deltaproteobacteria bacterium]
MPGIIVHGGAGRPDPAQREPRRQGLALAAECGLQCLRAGGSALDAVVEAVELLEDLPSFNAGTGSVLTWEGTVEMDASVMEGEQGGAGVGVVSEVRHPVRLARLVLEQTDHALLCGPSAVRLARRWGLPPYDPVTPERRARWAELRCQIREAGGGEVPEIRYLPRLRALQAVLEEGAGTVGAVAIDRAGHLAVATSTGGLWLKLAGRVGDSAIIGAGSYAARWGAASATGHGEGIIRLGLARLAVDWMERLSAQEAAEKAVDLAGEYGVRCGLIGVDRHGRPGAAFNTEEMATASATL